MVDVSAGGIAVVEAGRMALPPGPTHSKPPPAAVGLPLHACPVNQSPPLLHSAETLTSVHSTITPSCLIWELTVIGAAAITQGSPTGRLSMM